VPHVTSLRAVVGGACALLVAGCAGSAATPAPTRTTTAPPDPLTVCVAQLSYWAEVDLSGAPDPGYDYQHRGLTSGQADALRALVAEAADRAPERVAGFVSERVQAACEELTRE
jgi:hypothetical protein